MYLRRRIGKIGCPKVFMTTITYNFLIEWRRQVKRRWLFPCLIKELSIGFDEKKYIFDQTFDPSINLQLVEWFRKLFFNWQRYCWRCPTYNRLFFRKNSLKWKRVGVWRKSPFFLDKFQSHEKNRKKGFMLHCKRSADSFVQQKNRRIRRLLYCMSQILARHWPSLFYRNVQVLQQIFEYYFNKL